MEAAFFLSIEEFCGWLENNYDKAKELWVGFYKKVANNMGRFVNDAYMVYICIKTKYYGKTKYIVHKTK